MARRVPPRASGRPCPRARYRRKARAWPLRKFPHILRDGPVHYHSAGTFGGDPLGRATTRSTRKRARTGSGSSRDAIRYPYQARQDEVRAPSYFFKKEAQAQQDDARGRLAIRVFARSAVGDRVLRRERRHESPAKSACAGIVQATSLDRFTIRKPRTREGPFLLLTRDDD